MAYCWARWLFKKSICWAVWHSAKQYVIPLSKMIYWIFILLSTMLYCLARRFKAIDTLEDPGSSILSYRSQVTRGVFYYVPKKKSYFLVVLTTIPNFNPFLSNISLVNEFILLIPRSYNRKETDNILVQKKENNRWWEECSWNNIVSIP